MKELNAYRAILNALPTAIKEAEVNADKRDILSVSVIDGKIVDISASDQTTLYVRASGEKTGVVSTENLEENPEIVLKAALENSIYLQSEKIEPMNTVDFLSKQIQEEENQTHTSVDQITERLKLIEFKLKTAYSDFKRVAIDAREEIHTVGVVNSKGCDQTYSRKVAELKILASGNGGERDFFIIESISAQKFEEISVDEILNRLNQWQNTKVMDMECLAGSYKAVLSNTVMTNILITAWKLFSGQNYRSNSTVFANKLGHKIASDSVNIMDLPILKGSGYEFPFDCEGSEGIQTALVKNGVLTGLLNNLTTAAEIQQRSTGNAGRTPTLIKGIDITVTPKNFCLMPGENSLDELLHEMKEGIYIYESYDVFHSINVGSGDYAIPCNVIVVQDGKKIGKADGVTINGNIADLFRDIISIGKEMAYLPLEMQKTYLVASPAVLVASVAVSGSRGH